jgi:hypothetical protein
MRASCLQSHRYQIAALRQYMVRPAKPIKLTT